jgi:hypothetical protein
MARFVEAKEGMKFGSHLILWQRIMFIMEGSKEDTLLAAHHDLGTVA